MGVLSKSFLQLLEDSLEQMKIDDSSMKKLVESLKTAPDRYIIWSGFCRKLQKIKDELQNSVDLLVADLIEEAKQNLKSASLLNIFIKYELVKDKRYQVLRKDLDEVNAYLNFAYNVLKMFNKKIDIYLKILSLDNSVIVGSKKDTQEVLINRLRESKRLDAYLGKKWGCK